MTQGYFITLEGGEGAGKTTQANLLEQTLRADGYDVLRTREPGGSPGSELLRGMLLNGPVDWSAQAEILLHFAARAEHVAITIAPALQAGRVIICDRFFDSTLAYQGYGAGGDHAFIAAQIALLGIRPDLTIVLDVPDALAAQRVAARGKMPDRYERLDAAFHARVRDGFRIIAKNAPERCVLMNAAADIETVCLQIVTTVRQRLHHRI
jgi:dTMP kinase